MRRVALAFSIVLLWACAQRDNPFDPSNSSGNRVIDTGYKPPQPSGQIRVVLPDSAGRSSDYYGNIQAALADLNPGDTLYVQGGHGRTYAISGLLRISHGGVRLLPVVIRSFGGEARILARSSVPNCLRIDQGWVHLSGFAFVGSQGPAIIASGVTGDVQIDSCRADSSGAGMDLRDMYGRLRLRDISMTGDTLNPPFTFLNDTGLDTSRLSWR